MIYALVDAIVRAGRLSAAANSGPGGRAEKAPRAAKRPTLVCAAASRANHNGESSHGRRSLRIQRHIVKEDKAQLDKRATESRRQRLEGRRCANRGKRRAVERLL